MAKKLKATHPDREWALGTYLWMVWVARMKEVHNENYIYIPANQQAALLDALLTEVSLWPL